MHAHKWSERATAALAVLALVSMAAPVPVVHAATTRAITVHDIPDDSPELGCSLREAIGVANAGGTGTVDGCTVTEIGSGTPIAYAIYLPGGTYQYVLTGAAGEDGNASGDLDITANVNIRGWGAGSTIVDGGKIDRVFHICPGGGCANTVIFTDVTISGGSSTGSGGGIYNVDGSVTVDGSTVSANTAVSDGGGIYNETGTLTVQNGSTVSVNTATDDGGGIYNADGGVTVDGSTVSSNAADYDGGGICIKYPLGTLTVQNGSTVSANTATDGGGIYNGGTTTVDGSTVIGNEAANDGGGIYNAYIATVNISTVSANTAVSDGGGIYNDLGTLNVQNGSTIGGIGAGNEADTGGGIYSEGGAVTVHSSTISANTAGSWGGGIAIFEGGTLNVQNGSTIGGAGAGNEADEGGGIWNWDGTVTVDGSTISSNTATDDWGGGICNWQGTVTVDGSTVSGNTAVSDGGGIWNWDGTVTVTGSTVSANTAADGGGIYNENGTMTVTGSRILNNTATNDGGGIFSSAAPIGATSVTGSCIVGNSDTAFFNDELAIQTATGNWWGAASGPSGVGPGEGDSVSANVDYSGFLTEPILGCYLYVYLPLVVR